MLQMLQQQLRHVEAAHVLSWKTIPAPWLRENEALISPPTKFSPSVRRDGQRDR